MSNLQQTYQSSFQTKYRILQKIGEGSFSEVLKCENRQTGEYFAAKRLKKTYKKFSESVLSCAEIIASQKVPFHENVLNLLEYHYDSLAGKVIFIFELMDMSMYDFLKNRTRRIAEQRVKGFLYQILRGLNHLHSNGLFHRDVKPENILIRITAQCEIIKLADLGSVRGVYSEPPYTEYISTRWYRSPECLLTVGNYGPKMDIWATGCVFYEMLTLKPLFPGANEVDQLFKIHAVIGTPNGKLLDKLKNKSRNCTFFPETTGIGIYQLSNSISDQGKRALKLMLEYDPDKRINTRRLLTNPYFDSVRDSLRLPLERGHRPKMNRGDDWTLFRQQRSTRLPTDIASDELVKKRERRFDQQNRQLEASRTVLDIERFSNPVKGTHKLRENTDLLVDPKSLKRWGVKPSIFKVPPSHDKTNKVRPKNKPVPDKYRKTTSNLPQFKAYPGLDEATKNKYRSKSFVLPSKSKASPTGGKLETIQEKPSKLIKKGN